MPSAISLVTLLTDFGDTDFFVPSLKGVLLGINPQIRIVDLSHRVPAHGIEHAAFFLKSCYEYYPDGTVHVVVVDPDVGSDRRALLVSTSRYFFLAPDNGVLSPIFQNEASVEVRAIENKQYRLDSAGATFDGRDLFAPSAAWLTKGQSPGSYGRLITDYVTLPDDAPKMNNQVLQGRIMYIDHFGNGITNITSTEIETFRSVTKKEWTGLIVGELTVKGIKGFYGEGATGLPELLMNSNGHLEIFIKQGRAADRCGLQVGQKVELF
ncbi:MAG: SAM-dependent chlorinase/fluorinase [Nitrospirota bacterium]|nr:SAM-dependent chlorinase/fluorinase [Nitrospinota bacterium]MDH5586965.1 SAM-dependent chlorinase/fluorinase [Nitrospirota bacterium]MDH5775032.1 SAM-dependent chlorinase/fluorinase [Nitrospirota bacterium]